MVAGGIVQRALLLGDPDGTTESDFGDPGNDDGGTGRDDGFRDGGTDAAAGGEARNATALRALRVQREARRGNSDVDLFLVVPPDATARAAQQMGERSFRGILEHLGARDRLVFAYSKG